MLWRGGLLIACLLCANLSTCNGGAYSGSRIYRLWVTGNSTEGVSEALEKGEADSIFDVLKEAHGIGDFADVMVHPAGINGFEDMVRKHGITSQVQQWDVDASVKRSRRENELAKSGGRSRRSTYRHLEYKSYMSFTEMETTLKEISRDYELATLEEFGKSVENRSLWVLKISANESLPIIWIDAGIHAREWIAPASAFYLIGALLSTNGTIPLTKYQFYIAPNINPDGYQYSFYRRRYWRKNRGKTENAKCYGVDLNRNFPFHWGRSGASSSPCSDIFKGASSADQAESQSVIRKLNAIAPKTKLYLTLHSYGQYILTPFGYRRGAHPINYDELIKLANLVMFKIWRHHGNVYATGSSADLLYAAAGGSDDFARGILNIPYAYTIELPDYGGYNFLLPPSFIPRVGEQMWTAVNVFVDHMK